MKQSFLEKSGLIILVASLIALAALTSSHASQNTYIAKHGVVFSNGNKYQAETDVTLTRPVGTLSISRYYNSQREELGIFGYGWSGGVSGYSWIKVYSGRIVLISANGKKVYFNDTGAGSWENESGGMRTIIVDGNGDYKLTELDSTTSIYDDVSGNILTKTERNGNQLTFTYNGSGQLETVTDTFGATLTLSYVNNKVSSVTTPIGSFTYTYDANDNLVSVAKPGSAARQYSYSDANDIHNLTGIIDEKGVTVQTITYDAIDRVTSSTLANGDEQVTINYLADNQRKVTDINGVETTYQLEADNGSMRVASISGPGCTSGCGSSGVTDYIYNSRQQVTQETDGNGNITTHQYDAKGNRTSTTEAVGTADERTTTWTHELGTDRILNIINSSVSNPGQSAVTTFNYDSVGNLLTKREEGYSGTTAISRTTTYTYDSFGRILTVDGPRTDVSDVTSFEFYPNTPDQNNNRGFLKKVTNALGHETTFSQYNGFGEPELITTPTGTIATTYNTAGRLLSKDINGITQSYTYDNKGHITRINLPGARYVDYTYDDNGRALTVTDSLNNSITYTYDTRGHKIKESVKDPGGVLTRFVDYTYEDSGKLDQTILADGSTDELNYDPVGNIIERINALSLSTDYAYDALNRLVSATEPGSVVTTYDYDSNDNLISVTDAEGNVTSFTYDDFGRKTSRTSPDTGLTLYAYDGADNLLSKTDSNGVTVSYTYDALRRLTFIDYPSDPDITYAYDGNGDIGQLTSVTDATGSAIYNYDQNGRLTDVTRNQGGQGFALSYGYNDNGELTSITYPSGRVVDFVRNTAGQVTTVTSDYGGLVTTIADSITYLPFGPREDMNLGNNVSVDSAYDLMYRLSNTTAVTLYDRNYQYIATGHVSSITDNIDPTASQTFTYDNLGRLDTANGKYGSYDWALDKVGNRLSETLDANTTNYTYEADTNRLSQATGQATTTYGYDYAGNMTSKDSSALTWSEDNRLQSVVDNSVTVGAYGYDSRGLRTERTVNGETTYSVYDQSGNVLAEIDSQGNIVQEYVYLENTRLALYDVTSQTTLTVDVTDNVGTGIENASVKLYTAGDVDTGISGITNIQGTVTLDHSSLAEGEYKLLITYLDLDAWSDVITLQYADEVQVQLAVNLEPVTVSSIIFGGEAMEGAVVSVYSAAGDDLYMDAIAGSNGNVTFMLPEGGSYKFKVVFNGATYWSDVIIVGAGPMSVSVQDWAALMPVLQMMIEEDAAVGGGGSAVMAGPPNSGSLFGSSTGFAGHDAAAYEEMVVLEAQPEYESKVPDFSDTGEQLYDAGVAYAQTEIMAVTTTLYDYKVYYYLSDHLSTAQLLLNAQGTVVWQGNYTPFGGVDIVVNTIENNFRFPGQYFDAESGLYYNWNRYYDPETGRYVSADPIGLDGGVNLYAYVGGNPLNLTDIMGLAFFLPRGFERLENEYGAWDNLGYTIFQSAMEESDCLACTASCSLKVYLDSKAQDVGITSAIKIAATGLAKEGIKKAIPVYNIYSTASTLYGMADCYLTCKKKSGCKDSSCSDFEGQPKG